MTLLSSVSSLVRSSSISASVSRTGNLHPTRWFQPGGNVKAFTCTAQTTRRFVKFKILFCGSDEFSVASLKAVYEARDLWESIDVVVPPDKDVGRGGKHHKSLEKYISALKRYADSQSLPTHTIPSGGVKSWTPPPPFDRFDPNYNESQSQSHILLTASFGQIIPLKLLNLFPADHRLNVHPSLLPKYRGAAPVQWTIANGDSSTGVSVQRLVKYSEGVDAGDIVGSVGDIAVPADATYNTFLPHLAEVGGDLLVKVLRELREGTATFKTQDANEITLAPKITHETARIRWSEQTAEEIDRLHRGIRHQVAVWSSIASTSTTSPTSTTTSNQTQTQAQGQAQAQVHLISLRALSPSEYPTGLPGSSDTEGETGIGYLIKDGKSRKLVVSCAKGTWLEILEVQMAGKKVLGIKEWYNGLPKVVRESGIVRFS
ncbi:methionyl-tRNA formyltransferase [Kwoniella dejecticola CBS 10117]|uniref:methionyl-tRNA formyltransferase n=1 Tax=Kwoniella dejecticola CBS 10117 TaxID=1296121 RepID=A0A1A6A0M9_9TREE|nr:methionyl-tRNA formyltransferase [Kwoniella dejecticola CBS 10117]OBR83596.1 methionyl-tRNA formyltransferase [Kwoniella dejecticola CBS 10117]